MNLEIIPSAEFIKSAKKLSKKFKMLHLDLDNLKSDLLENPKLGTDLGNSCYKVRLENSSIPTGKRGGFRVVIYYVDNSGKIRLITIYSKKDKENISDKELKDLLNSII